MPIEAGAAAPAPRRAAFRIDYGRLTNRVFAAMVFCGAIALIEPSPYDFASFAAIAIWILGGFKVHPVALFFAALIFVYNMGGFIALAPHLDEELPTIFMLQSLYLAVTAVFFVLFFAEDTERRAEICLRAFAASTVLASVCGILGYFDVAGSGALFSLNDRASGTFKDPNVLGSYLIMGALYFLQNILLVRTRHLIWTGLAFLVVVTGVFLSFSRGSWLAFAVAVVLSSAMTVATAPQPAIRRRALMLAAGTATLGIVALALLLSFSEIRDFFVQRAALTQEYDVGETGRFGNQSRSIGMLLDRINGFGPLRFRLTFGLDPHNSYINAFASYGWLGACAFFLLVGLTVFVGFRVACSPSPYRRLAQVYWPALLVFLLQGFQIDIDHWRHVYLMLGAVWGLEIARLRWQDRGAHRDHARAPQAARVASMIPSPAMPFR